jgi:hypothetical protein
VLEVTIAGIEKITMKAVTSIDQTNNGNPVQRHARRAALEDRRHELDGDGKRRHLGERDQLRPEIASLAGREVRTGQRHVREPARVRRGVQQHRRRQHQPAEEIQVVAERVEPRERDVSGADHQRHQVDAHRLHHRHGEQEHHHRAVRGEDLVVEVRAEEVIVGNRQLDAHQRGENARRDEEAERGGDIPLADRPVIDHAEPADQTARNIPGSFEFTSQVRFRAVVERPFKAFDRLCAFGVIRHQRRLRT